MKTYTIEDLKKKEGHFYQIWRRKVIERDKEICQECGFTHKSNCAHHIKEWYKYPEERFKIDNGSTRCWKCHTEIHRWEKAHKCPL